jgi:hypothetical protein
VVFQTFWTTEYLPAAWSTTGVDAIRLPVLLKNKNLYIVGEVTFITNAIFVRDTKQYFFGSIDKLVVIFLFVLLFPYTHNFSCRKFARNERNIVPENKIYFSVVYLRKIRFYIET